VFDLSERLDDFLQNKAPLKAIVFDYYVNFVPYFVNLFSGLFTFIAVIFFTSKMATHSEIIAILSGGVSYFRFLRPYFVGGILLMFLSFFLINWVIPHANAKRMDFEEKYYRDSPYQNKDRNIHRQISPGLYIYMQSYNTAMNIGYRFALERFEGGALKEKINSDYIKWDTAINKWTIHNYYKREFDSVSESLTWGQKLDTVLPNFDKSDYSTRTEIVETMNYDELTEFIAKQKLSGSASVAVYELEKHKRFAFPFSTIILAIMGACISSQKKRGGVGINIGLGLALAFSYIMMQQVTMVFATNAGFNPFLSLWIPNFIYAAITFILYKVASR
jgi:lipopolysaccharide export system permease protein